MGSKSAGPGVDALPQGDVPAFDMPPTQQSLAPWNVNNPTGGGPNMKPFPGQRMIPPGMGPGLGGGQGPRPQMSPEDQIRMLYMSQLGRSPDQGGMDFWRQQMAGGMNQDQIMNAMRNSAEGQSYQQRLAPMMDDFGRGQMNPDVMATLRAAQQQGGGRQPMPLQQPQIMALLRQLGVM